MSELQGIARFKFDDGKLEEFKRLSAQCMEIARTKDTGTLQYEIYFNDGQSECIVLERYKDSEAFLQHAANFGDLMEAMEHDPRAHLLAAVEQEWRRHARLPELAGASWGRRLPRAARSAGQLTTARRPSWTLSLPRRRPWTTPLMSLRQPWPQRRSQGRRARLVSGCQPTETCRPGTPRPRGGTGPAALLDPPPRVPKIPAPPVSSAPSKRGGEYRDRRLQYG